VTFWAWSCGEEGSAYVSVTGVPDRTRASFQGPSQGPSHAQGHHQSGREAIYHSYVRELLRTGQAYLCFATREELAQVRSIIA